MLIISIEIMNIIDESESVIQGEFRVSIINYFKRKRIIRFKACCGGV